MKPAILATGLSKRYRIGALQTKGYQTLREALTEAAARPFRRLRDLASPSRRAARDSAPDTLWALKDVSFRVEPGELVGVIGRNGAGKSTLLKVISRITQPTEGELELRGRIGSLLEVGTGFHAELTGRENVFLSGAILGMSRHEVARKFDEIVSFSEVEKFIDTPVKRYSSGMYMRLAFAVAAHLDPRIMLIDEVLAVGDLGFQSKCLDYVKRLRGKGATVLFVSHDMFAVKAFCTRVIYLAQGKVRFDGDPESAIQVYEKEGRLGTAAWAQNRFGADPTKNPIHITRLEVLGEGGAARTVFNFGERMRLRLHFATNQPVTNPNFTVGVTRSDGVRCCHYSATLDGFEVGLAPREGAVELLTPPLKFMADMYALHVNIWDPDFQNLYCAQDAGTFHVRHERLNTHFGVFYEPAEWGWAE